MKSRVFIPIIFAICSCTVSQKKDTSSRIPQNINESARDIKCYSYQVLDGGYSVYGNTIESPNTSITTVKLKITNINGWGSDRVIYEGNAYVKSIKENDQCVSRLVDSTENPQISIDIVDYETNISYLGNNLSEAQELYDTQNPRVLVLQHAISKIKKLNEEAIHFGGFLNCRLSQRIPLPSCDNL